MPSRRALWSVLTLAAMALPAPCAWAQPEKPTIDNDRLTVWDVKLAKGQSAPPTPPDMDAVIMVQDGGPGWGHAAFIPRGSAHSDTAATDAGLHEVILWLKNSPHTPVVNSGQLPLAFPRQGSVTLLENDRVAVHRYCWSPGIATPVHFHDKDMVLVYEYEGSVKAVTADGVAATNAYKPGDMRFVPAGLTHYEQLVTDRQCAMMTELK